jgi:succinate dehydrogenase hydrophobic anchor subunit
MVLVSTKYNLQNNPHIHQQNIYSQMATCRLTKPTNKQTNKQVAHHTMTNKFMGIYAFRVSSKVIMVLIVFYRYAMLHGGGGDGGGDGACIHHFGNFADHFCSVVILIFLYTCCVHCFFKESLRIT